MTMPGLQERPCGEETPSTLPAFEDSSAQGHPLALSTSPEHAKHWLKNYRTGVASLSSSFLSTAATYPLDSVKSRMQAYRYQHFTACVRHTFKNEGLGGFYRGIFAPIFSIALVRVTSFGIYQKAKYSYSDAIGRATGKDEPLVVVNRPGSVPTLATMACFGAAGGTAGALVAFVACPFELTKVSAQISGLMAKNNHSSMDDPLLRTSYQQKGTINTAKNIVKNHGYAGLYSGFGFHLLRDTIGTIIYFTTYESTKQLLVKFQKKDSPTSPLAVAIAGGFCGLASWALIYPIDSAKTVYQRNCLTASEGKIVKKPKIEFFNRKMYSGIGVSMIRSCLVNTIFFSSFEYIKKQINMLPDPIAEAVE